MTSLFVGPKILVFTRSHLSKLASFFEMLCFSPTCLFPADTFVAGCGFKKRPCLIMLVCLFRCIDIQQSNEGERTQALRLVRKVRSSVFYLFPYFLLKLLEECTLCPHCSALVRAERSLGQQQSHCVDGLHDSAGRAIYSSFCSLL